MVVNFSTGTDVRYRTVHALGFCVIGTGKVTDFLCCRVTTVVFVTIMLVIWSYVMYLVSEILI